MKQPDGTEDRPILFSAPMVRALLREARSPGTGKTMTRRPLAAKVPDAPAHDAIAPGGYARHPAPYLDSYCGAIRTLSNPRGMTPVWCWWTRDDRAAASFKVPFVPGMRLWVRETWRVHTWNEDGEFWVKYLADDTVSHAEPDGDFDSETFLEGICSKLDRAGVVPDDTHRYPIAELRSRPGIHMFRWASRLTLTVTGVKVERLQTISNEDAIAEGISWSDDYNGYHTEDSRHFHGRWPARCFESLWDTLHGEGAWEENPFVCAVSFGVALGNIDKLAA